VPTAITFVPLTGTITASTITTANVSAIFIGGIDNSATTPYLSVAETDAIKTWSNAAPSNLVVICQATATRWGWTVTNNNANPDQPTQAGFNTLIFNGPFGVVPQFNQGGSFQGTLSGGTGANLGVDNTGKTVFAIDAATKDLVVGDVDIFTDLGSISAGSVITNNNDKLLGNLFAYVIKLVSCPTYAPVIPQMCTTLPTSVRVGYIPNARDTDGDNGYTIDGLRMTPGAVPKLTNTANFGPSGTVKSAITFVPLNGTINASVIATANVNMIFIGGIDNTTATTYLTVAETDAIKTWSNAALNNVVIATQGSATRWGWTVTNNNINPDQPTSAGLNTVIFNGPFGVVPQFNQGGSFQGTLSAGAGTNYGVDNVGKSVFALDAATNDLIVGDVDIFTDLGSITAGSTITNSNDKLLGNIFAYAINLATCVNCNAGTTAPIITATTITNACPTTTFSLAGLANTGTKPVGTTLIWSTHKIPTSASDTLTNLTTVSTAGKYYALYFDKANSCYSPADSVTATITSCSASLTASNPPAQTATTSQAKTGTASTDLAPVGGNGTYVYSVDNSASCTPLVGATALPLSSNLTVTNSITGTYTYTAPATAGVYYYCIKVCDTTTPTANCATKTYKLTVTAPAGCPIGTITPGVK
jgi:hypothetical protein